MQHNLGTYNNLKEVWNRYPNGGGHGDYVIIDGEKLYWNELQTSWGDYEYEPEIIRPGIVYEGDIKVEGTGTFHEGIKIGDSIPGYSGALIDEFGNADYRRIDTDSLFIRDEESGNLVSLAKYIVRFKTELPPNWEEYQKLPLFGSARLLLFDGTSESRYYTTIRDVTDAIAAHIEATSGGAGGGSSIVVIRSDDETVAPSDSNVYSSLATLRQIDLALQFSTGAYLSRLHSDTAQGLIKFLQGLEIGDYQSGMHAGQGGAIDSAGNAELESLVLRSFLEVPSIRYNELEYIGEEIIIGAGAVLKDVEHLGDDRYRLTLKLEDGQFNPFRPSDLLKGIYNMDEEGNFTGFGTTYVSVSSINEHEMIAILADESDVVANRNMPPRKFMHLARIGNFTDADRQSYISLSAKDRAITQYGGVNAFAKKNAEGINVRAGTTTTQWGRAEGLEFIENFDNLPITKDSDVLYTDTLLYNKQIKVDYQGVVIKDYIDRGQWVEGMECQVTETTIDEVWYNSEKFRLIDRPITGDPFVTTEKPTRESGDWMLILSIKDGLLDEAEKMQLRASLDAMGAIVESVKGSYDKLLDNPFIHEDTMTSITTRYYAFIASWISDGDPRGLKPVILWIVNGDNIVDQNERDEKDRALNAFNLALYEYNQAEKEVYNDVGDEIEDVQNEINSLEDFTNKAFEDGIIDRAEAKAIEKYINTVNESFESVKSTYDKMLLNSLLITVEKAKLTGKYTPLSTAKGNLITSITTAIADGVATKAEKADVDTKFGLYNTAMKAYQTALEEARIAMDVELKRLADAKVDEAVIKATYWSIKASTPVIYKDSNSATASGVHTPVTVNGELRSGTTTTQGGFISIQPNGGAETTATASPRTIAPTNAEGKTSYTVRLYEKEDKVTLLDTMTIPVVFKGASGVNAINASLSNEADVLPASPEGVVSDYAGSGTIIRVFEGATELTYGIGNGQYQVSASGSGINVGTPSTVGNTRVYGAASNMISDNATITFTISGKTSSEASFNLTKVQAFAKSRVGQKGKDAVAPIIDENGFWAFWNKETETFIPSEFSAIGDDGHAPIIRDGYWYEWNPALEGEDKYQNTGIKAEGEDGKDGITISQNQQGYTYRADLNGDIIGSLANGMVELTITSGSTPITCSSSTSGGTPILNGTYRVIRTLGNGITTNQSLSGGKYRITPATLTVDEASVELEIKIMMGGVVTSYPLTLTYRKQFDGADGKSTEFIFKGSISDTTAPTLPSTNQQDDWYGQGTTNEWNDDLVEPTKTLPYVWASQRKKVDGVWGAFTTPKVWLRYAEDGDGITSTTIEYAKSSNGTTPPSSGWSTSLPSPTEGWYLWTRTTITYKVAITTVSYSVSHWAKDGDGIVSTTIEYAKSSSGTTIPTSGWDILIPSPTKGMYLWTRTTTVYKKSPTTVAYSTSYWAEDGINGEPPKILNGYPKTQYAIGDSKTIYPTSGWGGAIIDVTESKPYLWSRQEIKYDSGDTLYTGYLMLTNISPASYMFGEWDLRIAYTRNEKSYPIVTYLRASNRPLYYYPKKEGVIEYPQFLGSVFYQKGDIVWYENTIPPYNTPLGLYRAKLGSNSSHYSPYHSSWWENVTSLYAPNGAEGQKLWTFIDGMELIITEALMANFAKLDSFVFNDGKMFSQEGTLRGVAGSVEYTDEDHEPNFEVEGVSGKVKMKDAEVEGVIVSRNNMGSMIASMNIEDKGEYIQYYPSGNKMMEFNGGVITYYENNEDNTVLWTLGRAGAIISGTIDRWQVITLTATTELGSGIKQQYIDGVQWRVFSPGSPSSWGSYRGLTITNDSFNYDNPSNIPTVAYIPNGWYTDAGDAGMIFDGGYYREIVYYQSGYKTNSTRIITF